MIWVNSRPTVDRSTDAKGNGSKEMLRKSVGRKRKKGSQLGPRKGSKIWKWAKRIDRFYRGSKRGIEM